MGWEILETDGGDLKDRHGGPEAAGLDVDGDIVAEIGELGPGGDGGKMQIIHIQHPDSPLSAVCADGCPLEGGQLGGKSALAELGVDSGRLILVMCRCSGSGGLYGGGLFGNGEVLLGNGSGPLSGGL